MKNNKNRKSAKCHFVSNKQEYDVKKHFRVKLTKKTRHEASLIHLHNLKTNLETREPVEAGKHEEVAEDETDSRNLRWEF